MSLLDSLWLGVVQGLTEFLPISSDGHLALAHMLLGAVGTEDLFFDLILHLGTLVAVITVFSKDIWQFGGEALRGLGSIGSRGLSGALAEHEGLRLVFLIVVASVPTAFIGLLLKKPVESHAFGLGAIGVMFIINGVTLYSSRFAAKRALKEPRPGTVAGIGVREALIIGIAQGLAVLPAISRSGSTIVTSLWLGADRERAAQFSFLMSIPAILGAALLQADGEAMQHAAQNPVPYVVGTLVSAAVGIVALKLLLRLLKAARFHHFAWYCWGLGAVALITSLISHNP